MAHLSIVAQRKSPIRHSKFCAFQLQPAHVSLHEFVDNTSETA